MAVGYAEYALLKMLYNIFRTKTRHNPLSNQLFLVSLLIKKAASNKAIQNQK